MRIGVDLGGTKIEAIALDDDGREHARARMATPPDDYPATIAAIATLVKNIEEQAGQTGTVGIGIPGAISPATGLIKNANNTSMTGHKFDRDISQALDREVRLANDADCFALSEATDGAGAGAKSIFGIILGTGVGGGIVVDGKLLAGPNAIAGEWGHNPLPWPTKDELPGRACYCGRNGCIETWVSGPGMRAHHTAATGQNLSAPDIYAAATKGDPLAEQTMTLYIDRLARALATVINLIDPEIIVFGGGLSNIDRLARDVPKVWTPYVFSDRVDTKLANNQHGDSSGVRGAAWLWPLT